MLNRKKMAVDLCVVGGGLAGMCAAIAAARGGSKVVIMQDRPMFGGNASSEIRMWVCGSDGSNNRGEISPEAAAEIAKKFGVRIYTIGVGTNGTAPYPYGGQVVNVPVEIDETTLNKIATITDGNYYRATSNSKLKEVYEKIDKLERTKLNVKEFSTREEEFQIFAFIAFVTLLLELLLRNTILKKIP